MKTEALFGRFAKYYDLVYAKKKYRKEVEFIIKLIRKNNIKGKQILDVACGTGSHAKILDQNGYAVTGIDHNKEVLKIARKKVPNAKFIAGDMQRFHLEKKFDVIICMFTAINYCLTLQDLIKTLQNFKKHLIEKGIIIFDSPLPRKLSDHATFVNNNLVLLYKNQDVGNIRELVIYWILRKKGKVVVIKDLHRLKLYILPEFLKAIKLAGLKQQTYWDFSLRKKKRKRLIVVCRK